MLNNGSCGKLTDGASQKFYLFGVAVIVASLVWAVLLCASAGKAYAQERDDVGLAASSLTTQAKDLASSVLNSTVILSQNYTGSEIRVDEEIDLSDRDTMEDLAQGVDYTLTYNNNINVGTATIIIKGIGNYTGQITESFKITQESMYETTCAALPAVPYTGSAYTPKPTFTLNSYTLKENTDYILQYSYNTDAGQASITATGIGNFEGSKYVYFTIKQANISSATMTIADQKYSGYTITPDLNAKFKGKKLKKYEDYSIAFKNNKNPGTAKAVVTGRGNFYGTKTVTFKIKKVSVASASVTGVSPHDYTGKKITQSPTVKASGNYLHKGTDYTVSYKNNKNAGTASMIIKGKGGYTGKKTIKFKIRKAANLLYAFASGGLTYESNLKTASKTMKAIYISGAKGKVVYAKKSGSANLTVNQSTGMVTVKKGTKAGTYFMKVNVKAAGTTNYKSASKTVTVDVEVF